MTEETPMLGHVTVTFEGRTLGFDTNDRGIIDATNYFNVAEFQPGGITPLSALRVVGLLLHHTAGWYGPALTQKANLDQEFAQLVAMARDQAGRAEIGIGPAYNLAAFPSGRVWAIGKHGTRRAHTAGRDPQTGEPWNVVGRAVVAFGNYETEAVTRLLGIALIRAFEEMRTWKGVVPDAPIYEHGLTPTVNSAGVRYSQATSCPGRNLAAWRAAGGLTEAVGGGAPQYQPDPTDAAYARGYQDAARTYFGKGAAAAYDLIHANDDAAMRLVSNPPGAAVVPATPADLKKGVAA
ncbi:MAG: hypothetical protein EPO65_07675 [Dehalococcoidia bacterium]|nr:MAG: hypothetical protein EPO65_07675 [Dehalococcoidia bacterium]